MQPRLLISNRIYPEAVEYLRERADVEYHESDESYPPEQLLEHLADKDGVVSQLTDRFSDDVMAALPSLKVISNVAVGFDNIDIEAATNRRVAVTNTPEVLTETTADLAFTLLAAAARRVGEAERFLRGGKWQGWGIDQFCGVDLHHATLGILGMGRIGRALARRARGFEMELLYHDAVRASDEIERELGLTFVPLKTLLAEADFISVHVPLMPQTRHLISEPQFSLMKKTAVLINTSRGPVVDEAALAAALEQGEIAAAGLDVFENEPRVERRLLALDNVVLTPHIASASTATRRKMCMMAVENALAALAGKRPPNLVNRALFPDEA